MIQARFVPIEHWPGGKRATYERRRATFRVNNDGWPRADLGRYVRESL